MHQKINDLAGQAFQYAASNANGSVRDQLDVFADKFVELIVLKILERIEESITDFYDIGDVDTASALEALAITILDDFDVELPEGDEQ